MNRSIRFASALTLLAATLAAQAQEAGPAAPGMTSASSSRAEVIASVLAARASGQLMPGNESSGSWRAPTGMSMARETVHQQAVAALRQTAAQKAAQRQIIGM